MYAVIETGGKQYKVAVGDKVEVELVPGNKGDLIELDRGVNDCRRRPGSGW